MKEQKARRAVAQTLTTMHEGATPGTGRKSKLRSRRPPASSRSARSTTRSMRSTRRATEEMRDALREAAEADAKEVAELRELLSRSAHVGAASPPLRFRRVGGVATASLHSKAGLQDDIVTLHRQRKMEEANAAKANPGRPAWDSSIRRADAPAYTGGGDWPRHASMIDNGMRAFRKELAGGEHSAHSARRADAVKRAAADRAARIAARSPTRLDATVEACRVYKRYASACASARK